MKLFSPDSKFMIAMSRLADLIILNFLFLITSIPLFTIGTASTALYTVTFRMGTDKDDGVVKPYFRAFRENFKQATVMWLLLLLAGICTAFDTYLFYRAGGWLHFLFIPFAIILIVILIIASVAFPLLSQFNNSTKQTILNGLLLGLGYLPRTILAAAMHAFPFLVFGYSNLLFFQTAFMWVFLYFSAAAYFSSLLLKRVFKPFMEPQEVEKTEEA